jgi:hypothetical protein
MNRILLGDFMWIYSNLCEFMWIYMNLYEFIRSIDSQPFTVFIVMNLQDFMWIYVNLDYVVNLHEFVRIYVNWFSSNVHSYEFIWIYMMDSYEFIWIYMNLCEFIWEYMWIYINLCGFLSFNINLCESFFFVEFILNYVNLGDI